MSKILVINGNPKKNSLCMGLAKSYAQGVLETGNDLNVVHISELDFDENLKEGYEKNQQLENDLSALQKYIEESSHIVIISPTWWGTLPAKLKGLIDRILLPGFAFKYNKGKTIPEKLLEGKTSRIVVTMDTPVWYYQWILGDSIIKTLKRHILEFSGIKVKNISRFGPVVSSTSAVREKWIQHLRIAGMKDSEKYTQ